MHTFDSLFHLPNSARRIWPALFGMLLLWVFVFSLEASAVESAVEPEALGTISGAVTDVASQPISGVNITLYRNFEGNGWSVVRSAQTDDAGAYVLPALRAGIYRLHFRDPQRRYAQEYYNDALTLQAATDVPVAGNEVAGIDVSLMPAALISGVVSILDVLAPDSGFVQLYTQVGPYWQAISSTAILTPTSAYQFGELTSGTYRVCAYAFLGDEFYLDTFYGCYGGVTAETAHDIRLAAGETRGDIDLRLGEGQYDGQITGTVTTDGAPLTGIKVSVYSSYVPIYPDPNFLPLVYTYTNAAGGYQLGGLQGGGYRVSFSDPEGNFATRHYRDQRRPEQAEYIQLPEGATISNINANLPRAGAISGRIRYADNRGVVYAQMSLYWFSGENWESEFRLVQPDAAGNYTVKALDPGIYRICVPFELSFGYPFPFYWFYYPNCYGLDRFSGLGFENATDITVVPGETVGGIDFTVGPALLYAPQVHNQ